MLARRIANHWSDKNQDQDRKPDQDQDQDEIRMIAMVIFSLRAVQSESEWPLVGK